MKMNITTKQLRLILLGCLGLAIGLFLAFTSLGLSMLSAKSQKMVELKLQSKTLDAQLSGLEAAKKDILKYSYFKTVAKTVIPNDKNQAQAVLDIFQIAQASGIDIQSVTFPASTLGSPSSSTVPASGSSSSSSTGDAQTAAPAKVISQAKPVTGINGLYSIELTIAPADNKQIPSSIQATYPKLLNFLDRIERNRRTAQVTQVTVQPSNDGAGLINFSLTVNIFIRP